MSDSTPPNTNAAPRFTLPPTRTLAKVALVALAVIIVAWLLLTAGSALTPFVIGAVAAYLLNPIVNRLNARMPRWTAILIVYAIVLLIFIGVAVLIVPPLVRQIQQLILALSSPDRLTELLNQVVALYEANVPPQLQTPIAATVAQLLPAIQQNLSTIAQSVGRFIIGQISGVVGVVSFLFGLLVVPIWLFYALNDSRKAKLAINRLLSYRIRADFWNAWELVDRSLSAFIRGQLTLGVIIAVAVWVGLVVLDFIPGIEVDYILLLAIWSGVAELVPMVGALLGAIPAVIIALIVGGPISALAVLGLFIVIQFVENNFLVPRVIGESVGVHPAVLLIALVVFSQVLGFIGVILAAPITAILRDLYLYAYRRLSGLSASDAVASISRKAQREAAEAMQSQIENLKS
jgi:predicted PurR-regulated permease PerM